MLIFWETVILEDKKSEKQREKNIKGKMRYMEVRSQSESQVRISETSQPRLSLEAGIKGPHHCLPFCLCFNCWPYTIRPSEVCLQNQHILTSVSNKIYFQPPPHGRMFKEKLIWPTQNSQTQHILLSLIAQDSDLKLRR